MTKQLTSNALLNFKTILKGQLKELFENTIQFQCLTYLKRKKNRNDFLSMKGAMHYVG